MRKFLAGILMAILVIALWPTLTAVFTPRTVYYPPQAPAAPAAIVPTGLPPVLVIPADREKLPYTDPPGAAIVKGMLTVNEPIPDPTRVTMLEGVTSISIAPQEAAQPEQQPTAAIVAPVVTRDWSNEVTAVTRNLENAVKIVELCATEKVKAALEMPPRLVDCRPAADNLETAKQKVYELQEAIGEGNQ